VRFAYFYYEFLINARVCGLRGAVLFLWVRATGRQTKPRPLPRAGASLPLLRYGTADARVYYQVSTREDYAVRIDPEPRLVVDCGAHIGLTTRYLAERFPTATVVAIEPDHGNFSLLEANTADFANVFCLHAALVGKSGPVSVENPDADTWLFRVGEPTEGSRVVPGMTVTDVLDRVGEGPIDILKLDIEGSERDVLSASRHWISTVEVLMVETHDRFAPGSSRAVYDATRDFPYEWHYGEISGFARRMPKSVPGNAPVAEWREGRFLAAPTALD
jgi:FkbM family methyltransferase